jgi:hypothetical protein
MFPEPFNLNNVLTLRSTQFNVALHLVAHINTSCRCRHLFLVRKHVCILCHYSAADRCIFAVLDLLQIDVLQVALVYVALPNIAQLWCNTFPGKLMESRASHTT